MNLPELIKKHNLKEGDKVNCVFTSGEYSVSVKTLLKDGVDLGFYECGSLWHGIHGKFELPEPVNKFVRSQCKNTAENQQALFALGYKWSGGGQNVQFLEHTHLVTVEDGLLYIPNVRGVYPERYEFTTVATLKPKSENQLEIERIENELKALKKQLKKLKESK
jgi:hypothetical protein